MTAKAARTLRAAFWTIFWLLLLGTAAYYLYHAAIYVMEFEAAEDATWLNHGLWYAAHIATAVPLLVIAPLQFIAALRRASPATHRILGRLFLTSSILAGAFAAYLGATVAFEGSRLPLALFGLLWIAFSVAAWICARRGDYAAHRQFVIRSFTIALAFVWLRLIATFQDQLLWFIEPGGVADTTREWMSLVIPLLVAEAWLSWAPALMRALRRPRRDLASSATDAT